jgi:hypothetical protein
MKTRITFLFLLLFISLIIINADDLEFTDYPIYVDKLEGAEDLIQDLIDQDLTAFLYEPDVNYEIQDPANSQAIWLGCYVPFEIALKAITTAYKHFPFLKYISINKEDSDCPEEIKYQIFIGGSTETALSDGLSPITAEDFKEAAKKFKNIDDLHYFIESYYTENK